MPMNATPQIIGTVKDGAIKVPSDSGLIEGALVQVIPLTPLPDDPPFLRVALELAKPRDWPPDFALHHGHEPSRHASE